MEPVREGRFTKIGAIAGVIAVIVAVNRNGFSPGSSIQFRNVPLVRP